MKKRAALLLVAGFFILFPVIGIVFVWRYAHAHIEKSADQVARQMAMSVLVSWDEQALHDLGTFTLRQSDNSARLRSYRAEFGGFKALNGLHATKSSVGERGDNIWQLVYYQGEAEFEKGRGELNLILARRAINKEWLIESLELKRR